MALGGQTRCVPFLKWAGGKRWLVDEYLHLVPRNFRCYMEPFLGSGALFFALQPERAILSDVNSELISTFSAIRHGWKTVTSILDDYDRRHSKAFYYQVRQSRPRSRAAKAAKFIYLNRTCWNGLYRVNTRGEFNVPIGSKERVVLRSDNFFEVSRVLKAASLLVSDFAPVIRRARQGDFIFADPPYVTAHSQNGFLKYNERLFSWDDQLRLLKSLCSAVRRGAYALVTNADTPAIRTLYEKLFRIRTLTRTSVIAASSANRGITTELVMTSW